MKIPVHPAAKPRRLSRRSKLVVGFMTAAAITAVSACGGGGEEAGNKGTDDTLVIANPVKIDTLDPAATHINEALWLDQAIFSRLVQSDPTGTKVVPDLASSWDIGDDKLTYTFHLRTAKFSDGTAVTASDVKYSLDRTIKGEAGWGFLLTAVKTITAPDDKTVVVSLSQPHAPLLADLAMYAFSILPKAQVEAQGDAFFKLPVSSGPFKVTSYKPDTQVDLVRNDDYYGAAPKIKNLQIRIEPNDNTRVLLLQSGEVDIIENPPGNMAKQIEANPKLDMNLSPGTRVDTLLMSTKDNHFSNVKVRQAVQAAVDLDQINKLAYQGTATPGSSFMPYKMLYWNDDLAVPTVDLDKAKSLLAAAGYPDGFKTNLITISGDSVQEAEAVAIKDALAKIGITVEIEALEQVTAYDKDSSGKYGLALRYWTNDIIDPDEVVTWSVDPEGFGQAWNTYWNNTRVVQLSKDARSESDPATREKMYREIQQIAYDEAPFMPLAYPPYRYATGKWVKGFAVSPLGNYNDSLLTLTVNKH